MDTFGDLFSYEEDYVHEGRRHFLNCIILKDAYNKKQGDMFHEIIIEQRNIYFDHERNFLLKKEPSLEKIQYEIRKVLLSSVHVNYFRLSQILEDYFGILFCFRTSIYIDYYRMAYAYELEKSVKTIKHHWKRVISNPKYLMCRRRLEREFNEYCDQGQIH